jgi:hypothetical protein
MQLANMANMLNVLMVFQMLLIGLLGYAWAYGRAPKRPLNMAIVLFLVLLSATIALRFLSQPQS